MQEIPKRKAPYDYNGNSSIKEKKWLIALLLSLIFATLLLKTQKERPPIGSLFYQPLLSDTIDWKVSFTEMQTCHIETLIIQWSQFGVVDFLKEEKWLREILTQAEQHHINVVVGLYGDDHYFKMLESPTTNRELYFQKLLKKNTLQAKKIYAIAKKYHAFQGWYIYDEIDDTNFVTTKQHRELKHYLQQLSHNLEAVSPQRRYISGYFSQQMNPKAYSEMFSDITQEKYTLLLQSGIGAHLVNQEKSSLYMEIFREHFQGDFIPIVEGFKIVESHISPSDFRSLEKQINYIKEASKQKRLSLFSLRYFLDPPLLKAYKKAYIQ